MIAISTAEEAIVIQKEKHKIQCLKDSYIKIIETNVSNLREDCRKNQQQLTEMELNHAFEMMWTNTISELHITPLKTYDIAENMLYIITEDMKNRGSSVNQKLKKIKSLPKSERVEKNSWRAFAVYAVKFIQGFGAPKVTAKDDIFFNSVLDECSKYVKKQIRQDADYNDAYCRELLKIINNMCEQNDGKGLHVVEHFQYMHDKFFKKNDPHHRLTALKPAYLATFINTFQEKDESFNRAKRFCESCIKPAVADQIKRILGIKIVDDVLSKCDSQALKDRTFFQYTLLSYLIQEKNVQVYIEYSQNYEQCAKTWIQKYIANTYGNFHSLQLQIASDAFQRIREVLTDPEILACGSVSDFLGKFCTKLEEELALNQDEIKAIVFQTTVPIKEFASNICKSLNDTEEELKSEIKHKDDESVLCKLTIKPEDELFKKVIGCGKQCPFCKVPCEAGASNHKKYFATIHRPQGLGRYRNSETKILVHEICSTSVVSNAHFRNSDTKDKYHPYRDYCTYYPDWAIQPDPSIDASDYWKFILKEFNKEFAQVYKAKPAEIPDIWQEITEEQAIESLKKIFNMQ
ncbi:hypothetical protein XELAEV_18045762mg [Xenopus laevis]|uniref:VLIG-type G domain-containing protein n=1 Tax=Xenopus laevis TaxID=8355 RepID=A0A974C196_XENLA|nr:hypothetical protein XELAEV_18045762mg [Xenopus laevis]